MEGQIKGQSEVREAALKQDVQWLGTMDPYVKLRFGRQLQKTKVHEDGGQFPKWLEEFDFVRNDEDDYVHLELWNFNAITSDQFIAEGGFSLTKVRKGGDLKLDQQCQVYGQGIQMGVINLQISFKLDPQCVDNPEVLAPDTTGQLIIKVEAATLQRDVSGWFTEQQPLAVVRFGDDEIATAVDSEGKLNPKWQDLLIFNRDEIQRDTYNHS